MKKYIFIGIAIVIVIILLLVGNKSTDSVKQVGSVITGSDYNATSTLGFAQTHTDVLKSKPGTLGSVIITTAGTGSLVFYDVSRSTDVNATNTMATIPASLAAGTYTFDIGAKRGIVAVFTSFVPVATITYR